MRVSSRLLHNHPVSPTQRQHDPHTCHCCRVSSSTSLHHTITALFLHLSHLSIAYLCLVEALETAVYHIVVYFFLQQLYMQIVIVMNCWSDVGLVQGFRFPKHIHTGLLQGLRHSAVAGSQGDAAAGEDIRGQVLYEFLAATYLSTLTVCHPRLAGLNFCACRQQAGCIYNSSMLGEGQQA